MGDAVDGGAFELAGSVARDAADQFASVSSAKGMVMGLLADHGFVGDKMFNTIHGDRQIFITTPDGATRIDVTDAEAPILARADYVVIGDVRQVVPALNAETRKATKP